ncbi:MAG: RNA-directed polymerase [Thermoanaerobaculia bacterium]|nr:RNA-directed polymerase [Thermoanaerobaculia bacterium]
MSHNSVRALAAQLGMPRDWLQEIANHADDLYAPYIDYSGRQPRTIDRPTKILRSAQRRIYRALLRQHPFACFAQAGVPRRSLLKAVAQHVAKPIVITADIRNFYPSVTNDQIFAIWRGLGHGTRVSALLTRLTTYRHRLPQGASTSMALANLLLEPVDRGMFKELRRRFPDVQYTRWVDDMIFSGRLVPPVVFEVVARHLKHAGLSIHHSKRKRRVMPAGKRQEVLGTVVNVRPSLSRQRRRIVRAIAHVATKVGGNLDSLRGRIQYLKTFHKSLGDQLSDSILLAPVLFKNRRAADARV